MNFIDLFAGLGGFHEALSRSGGSCVFASEINSDLATLYEKNFGIKPNGDIREIEISTIPDHDVLCAGFPCQPFSKAGKQKGLQCPQWGDLIDYVINILREKEPRYFIIENVPNLVRHDSGKTWKKICKGLGKLGYEVDYKCLSPHMFGIPQKRVRAFIVGDRNGLDNFSWPLPVENKPLSIASVLEDDPSEVIHLNATQKKYLSVWQEFLDKFPKDLEFPAFPIWAMEFGANYPLDGKTPHARKYLGLDKYKGAFGQPLEGLTPGKTKAALPGYARTKLKEFPSWKVDYIVKNRMFYKTHSSIIDPWIDQIKHFPPSFQKFEWNIKGGERVICKHIIQFRASGIRIKKTETAPSLITMTSQVPVIGWLHRFMTPRECSRLQSLGIEHFPETKSAAYKAFGNAVNVDVVRHIYQALIHRDDPINSVIN
ncbi:MAG: DNA cytosine methyltransferase [Paracoccaceae bacterium]|nr:DNA cytosine methyltransferase [Paracoccaceae bacterium]MDE2675435.1 DNA cytosine methyltransferase [Paracoccaceae bacterium]